MQTLTYIIMLFDINMAILHTLMILTLLIIPPNYNLLFINNKNVVKLNLKFYWWYIKFEEMFNNRLWIFFFVYIQINIENIYKPIFNK